MDINEQIMIQFANAMSERSGLATSSADKNHKEALPSRLKKDEADVTAIINHVINNMINPFEPDFHPDVLVNISTGLMHHKKSKNVFSKLEMLENQTWIYL